MSINRRLLLAAAIAGSSVVASFSANAFFGPFNSMRNWGGGGPWGWDEPWYGGGYPYGGCPYYGGWNNPYYGGWGNPYYGGWGNPYGGGWGYPGYGYPGWGAVPPAAPAAKAAN